MGTEVNQDLRKALQKLGVQTRPQASQAPHPPKRRKRKFLIAAIITILVVVCVVAIKSGARTTSNLKSTSPVPVVISKQSPYPIFYPDSKQLPSGYTLDVDSFSASEQAVAYSVTYGQDKKIAFTIQNKPSETNLKTFYANQLPLRHEVQLSIGTAAVGALNNQTLVSLPTNENSWLLITAPSDINQDHLKQVLRSIRKD